MFTTSKPAREATHLTMRGSPGAQAWPSPQPDHWCAEENVKRVSPLAACRAEAIAGKQSEVKHKTASKRARSYLRKCSAALTANIAEFASKTNPASGTGNSASAMWIAALSP